MTEYTEKVKELVKMFFDATYKDNRVYSFEITLMKHEKHPMKSIHRAKECALLCCEEMINSLLSFPYEERPETHETLTEIEVKRRLNYWQQVKQEIEKL